MSLIQEALKRQEEEAQQGPTTIPAPPPPPPPDVDEDKQDLVKEEPAQPKERAKSKPWAVLLGALAVILLLVGGAAWMLITAVKTMTDDVADTVVSTLKEAETPTVVEQDVPADPGEEAVAAVEPATTEGIEPPAQPAPVAAPEPAAEEPPVVSVPEPTEIAAPGPAPPQPVPAPEVAGAEPEAETPDAEVQWPVLKVKGIVGKGQRGAAVINGKVVAVGELIEGVKVVSVNSRGARLEYKGSSRHVRVGSSTEW